jgi:hypothetical protein
LEGTRTDHLPARDNIHGSRRRTGFSAVNPGLVMRTSDGGASWAQLSSHQGRLQWGIPPTARVAAGPWQACGCRRMDDRRTLSGNFSTCRPRSP